MHALKNRAQDVAICGIVALFLCGVLAVSTTLIVNGRRDALDAASEQLSRTAATAETAVARGLLSAAACRRSPCRRDPPPAPCRPATPRAG
ncbi:hypothetical protein [Noviherbaspirillum aridicola]|uniref:Uncharacterized protein n=1 Tax=Noviherbaspirillum aridicola TaxID=2849687 RepID=A0ABQ4Q8Y7_9BURK|nr:hypothetical protein [Noviherbaspirillum aridicola]GIZ53285.1 hypothetical protein NCCP691_32990 [Noviherbaspirillum aridicola]